MPFHLKMTGTSSADDVRVKVPSFQRVTFFLQYAIFHSDVNHLFFACMKMCLTAVIKAEHTSIDFFSQTPLFCYVIA